LANHSRTGSKGSSRLAGRAAVGVLQPHAGVGHGGARLRSQRCPQARHVAGVEEVVVVEKDQPVAAGFGHRPIGGGRPRQRRARLDQPKPEAPAAWRQRRVRLPAGVDHHDLDRVVGLMGNGGQCRREAVALHAAHQDGHKRHQRGRHHG
jgi:hypothetical protein